MTHPRDVVAGLFYIFLSLFTAAVTYAEPVVLSGGQLPGLLGKPVGNLRMCTPDGIPVPFQIDERTDDGEYVLDQGEKENSASGNGRLDRQDEIIFLSEDCDTCPSPETMPPAPAHENDFLRSPIYLGEKKSRRCVYITDDTSVAVSTKKYVEYDHRTQYLSTPSYYARFAPDRFHFTRAGIADPDGKRWIHLTKELRIEILLKALWGLLPVRYTEDNLICFVQRYKAGPLRLIRRGDFHLRMGLGIKGSRAAVNQICYPQMVSVPVTVRVPIRFTFFFNDAWIEMTPVIDTAGIPFTFSVNSSPFSADMAGGSAADSLVPCLPSRKPFSVLDNRRGFGWVLQTTIPDTLLNGSGFVFRRPSERGGIAECGYRLRLRDLKKGSYTITNWVIFSRSTRLTSGVAFSGLVEPVMVHTTSGSHTNRLGALSLPHYMKREK